MRRYRLLLHMLFNVGFFSLFWGAFECYYKLGCPIWSGLLGYPFPHHYLWGAVLAYCSYILLNIIKTGGRKRVK